MKKILLTILLILLILPLNGCGLFYNEYKGKHPDLYTVALNSILWCRGMSGWERHGDPTITILETDDYGRVLFYYSEANYLGEFSFSTILISQKTENNYVYFYPDYNFICKQKDFDIDIKELKMVEFSVEEKERLKEVNDWNKEINLEKCVKKEISNLAKKKQQDRFSNLIDKQTPQDFKVTYFRLTSDDYGRNICFHLFIDYDNERKFTYYVYIINDDLTYNNDTYYMTLDDPLNYQDELKAFKELNGWNTPL